MKICDRCCAKLIVETIVKIKTKEEVDLCEKCLEEFEEFRKLIKVVEEEAPRRGRPRKDGFN